MPESAAKRRAAVAALEPVFNDLHYWQQQAAYLEAMAQHHGASAVAASHARLLRRFHKGRAVAEHIIAELPDDIRAHSRVVDVLKALEPVAARLDRIG